MFFFLHSRLSGQTLIEVIIAIAIAGIVLTALTSIVLSSFSNVDFSENETTATQVAQDGIDFIRNMHDQDYGQFLSRAGSSYCLNQAQVLSSPTALCANVPNVGVMTRIVQFDNGGSECDPVLGVAAPGYVKIIVTVSWNDSKCNGTPFCHKTSLVSCFTDATVAPTL